MLARSRKLGLGHSLSGPLLIPSVSSKGFPIFEGVSEASQISEFAAPDMQEAMLISAYDLHQGLLIDGKKLLSESSQGTLYDSPELLVVDSGGYELSDEFESGETRRGPRVPASFTEQDFAAVVDALDKQRTTLVVSFDYPVDKRGDYRAQRETAQAFFSRRAHLLSDFLLKPPPGRRFIELSQLAAEAANLRDFDVIGVTEKELGATLLDRAVNLSKLRKLLDESGVDSPIHVFGALDPLLTPLYFTLGGEIFDGLSWMRYAYLDGVAMHPETYAVLSLDLDDDQRRRDMKRHLSNIAELKKIKHNLERWVQEPDRFEHLGPNHAVLRAIYETVHARVAGKR